MTTDPPTVIPLPSCGLPLDAEGNAVYCVSPLPKSADNRALCIKAMDAGDDAQQAALDWRKGEITSEVAAARIDRDAQALEEAASSTTGLTQRVMQAARADALLNKQLVEGGDAQTLYREQYRAYRHIISLCANQ
jgi:hypothetical protein